MNLSRHKCLPCRGGIPPMEKSKAIDWLRYLKEGWHINSQSHLEKSYSFNNFVGAMQFANLVTAIAETEGHHPDLHISWGLCRAEIWTHKINGLTESDFYLAAKIDEIKIVL